jgi:hypothetical protein
MFALHPVLEEGHGDMLFREDRTRLCVYNQSELPRLKVAIEMD